MDDAAKCSIRIAVEDDLAAVAGIHARHQPGSDLDGELSRRVEVTWERMMRNDDLTVYLAEVAGGAAVGTATAMQMPNITYDCAPTVFVEAVVVVPTHRRRGIATMIMQVVLDDARTAGCNKVQVLSHKRHAADGAHVLYESLGFEPEAEGFRHYLRERPASARSI